MESAMIDRGHYRGSQDRRVTIRIISLSLLNYYQNGFSVCSVIWLTKRMMLNVTDGNVHSRCCTKIINRNDKCE